MADATAWKAFANTCRKDTYTITDDEFLAYPIPLDALQHNRDTYAKVVLHDARRYLSAVLSSTKMTVMEELTLRALYDAHIEMALKGDNAFSVSTDKNSHAVARDTHAVTTCNYTHAVAVGNYKHSSTRGRKSLSATIGCNSAATTCGEKAHAATLNMASHAITFGERAHASAMGDMSNAIASGTGSNACATGDDSRAQCSDGVAVSLGRNNIAKAAAGGWLVLAAYNEDGTVRSVKTARCGDKEGDLFPDTWYYLSPDGEFVIAEDTLYTASIIIGGEVDDVICTGTFKECQDAAMRRNGATPRVWRGNTYYDYTFDNYATICIEKKCD